MHKNLAFPAKKLQNAACTSVMRGGNGSSTVVYIPYSTVTEKCNYLAQLTGDSVKQGVCASMLH